MSRQNSFDARAEGLKLLSGLLGVARKELTANIEIVDGGPILNVFDPGASSRDVILPPYKRGLWFFIGHDGLNNALNVKDSGGTTIGVVNPGELALYACSGNAWTRTPGVFGPAGVGHSTGFVPDPGAVAGLIRFLADDGTWKSVTTAGIVDAYKTVTDGTNDSVASGLSTLKFRSADNSIAIIVTNNDATHGDNVDIQVTEANVNHDALQNFVADKHVAHTAVTISGAGGLTGGGDISASRVLTLDITSLTAASPLALADTMVVHSAAAVANRKATLSALNAILVHDDLVGFSANRHVDHTAVSINAGTGLTGGGDISATRSLSLDLNGLATDTPSLSDVFAFWDVSGNDHNKNTFTALNAIFDHDALVNFVANKHIDHTAVSIATAANSGLTGGGTIAATRNLSVDINGTTEETVVDGTADFLLFWDASALALRKVKINNIPAAGGDVVGPASAVDGRLAVFNGTTGKLIADSSGKLAADVVTGPASSTSGNIPSFNGTGGKTLQDSGVAAANVAQASANFGADNQFVRADGTGKNIQGTTGATMSDTGAPTFPARLTTKVFCMGAQSAKTIAAGVITLSETDGSRIEVDTQGAAATDDLDTISGGLEGDIIILRSANAARDTTVKNGTGNITLPGGDHILAAPSNCIALELDGATWRELFRV